MSHAETGNAPATVIEIPARQRNMLDAAAAIELEAAADAGEVGFAARLWTQLALPYKDPGGVTRWERRNGDISLVVRPASLVRPDGTTQDGYPFGVIPRYLLTWISTEAVRTQSPVLNLGSSFNEFLSKLALGRNGRDASRLKDQVHRLVGSTIQVQQITAVGQGHQVQGRNLTIADSFDLWVPGPDMDDSPIWSNTITLSPSYFTEIIERPVPVDLRALRALRGSPMRLDIYSWMTHRLSYLSTTTLIPWSSLAVQFGGDFARTRKFKEVFARNLAAVHAIYPAAKYRIEEGGLRLYRSAPHLPHARRAMGDTA